MKKLFLDLFSNISIFYDKIWKIKNYIFYSFVLNVFYFYYKFCIWNIKSVRQDFARLDGNGMDEDGGKVFFKIEEESYHLQKIKQLIKNKIHPLLYVMYKLILFVESKTVDREYALNIFCLNNEILKKSNFSKLLKTFIDILKQSNETIKDDKKPVVKTGGPDLFLEESTMSISENIGRDALNSKTEQNTSGMPTAMSELKYEYHNSACDETNMTENFDNKLEGYNFYKNLMKHTTKFLFDRFLNDHPVLVHLKGSLNVKEKELDEKNDFRSACVSSSFQLECNFSLEDVKSICFHMIYKIIKTSFTCFCIDYFENLEKHLHLFLTILQDSNVKQVLCEDLNCHLINIFAFSSLFITYVEKVINTEEYRSLFLFLIKTILQRKIYHIYKKVFVKLKKVYNLQNEKNCNIFLLNKKITEIYNILLLDICFCENVTNKNTIASKVIYETLLSKYKENEWYYLKSCVYFTNVYNNKYNVYYSKGDFAKTKCNIHDIFTRYSTKKEKGIEQKDTVYSYLLKLLTSDILKELNNMDQLNNLIYQEHIRYIAQEQIKKSYFLYFIFVEGSTINNILNCEKEANKKPIHIFNFNKVEMINNPFIENNLFRFLF